VSGQIKEKIAQGHLKSMEVTMSERIKKLQDKEADKKGPNFLAGVSHQAVRCGKWGFALGGGMPTQKNPRQPRDVTVHTTTDRTLLALG